MRHRPGPRDMSSALEGVLARVEPKTPLAGLQKVWADAVGERLAEHGTPTAMSRDGVVTVACDAAVWAQELDLASYMVVEKLNAALGPDSVRELRCQATQTANWARQRRPARKK